MSAFDPKRTLANRLLAGKQMVGEEGSRVSGWEYDSLTVVTMAVRARAAGPANAANCGQAFVVRLEPAIAGTAAKIVMGAPARCSGFCDAKGSSENSESE
jgi:hypothetical protein